MKKHAHALLIAVVSIQYSVYAYQIKASNFYSPRPKTLRRIAKNLALAKAIENIYTHVVFSAEQQDLLTSIPTFMSNYFTPNSSIKTKAGVVLTVEQLIDELKKLEATITCIKQEPNLLNGALLDKVLKAIREIVVELEKVQ